MSKKKNSGSILQKGYKRNRKGIAVLYFFIGLIVLAIIVTAVVFLLRAGYDAPSDARSWVDVTAEPNTTPMPEATIEPLYDDNEDIVDISDEPVDEETPAPTPLPTDTPEPTATPEPTPLPTDTPEPTAIPASAFTQPITKFKVPNTYNGVVTAISKASTSPTNDNKVITMDGYAYIDDANFDGANAQVYVVIAHSSGKCIAYQANMIDGISGVEHTYTVSQNASKTDFEVLVDASQFPNGKYSIGTVIRYTVNGNTKDFFKPTKTTFEVNAGVISISLEEPLAEAPVAAAAPEAEEPEDDANIAAEVDDEDENTDGIVF